ncbi:MAG: hypothetical protein P4N59_31385 [Negativicutes bacterium]|nr:hypothetical protein [Negativicutes bacterium]
MQTHRLAAREFVKTGTAGLRRRGATAAQPRRLGHAEVSITVMDAGGAGRRARSTLGEVAVDAVLARG